MRGRSGGRHVAERHDDVRVVRLVVALEGPGARHAAGPPRSESSKLRVGEARGPDAAEERPRGSRQREAPGAVEAQAPRGSPRGRLPVDPKRPRRAASALGQGTGGFA